MVNPAGPILATLLGLAMPSATAAVRAWTDTNGRTFEAELVRTDGADAIFQLANGRQFSTPIASLSPEDQFRLSRQGIEKPAEAMASTFGRPWPREVRLDGPVQCKVVSEDKKAGRYIYESPGYRFTCDARVTDDALRNFSVMFETTRKYANSLPLSMGGGRERDGKLDVLLYGSMLGYVRAGGPPGSAGCFTRGLVMVPMESLGLKEGGTGFSLDTRRHNNVLVHELAHQLTPQAYLMPGALGWFSEGLAEYMAITPYNWGYFSPDIHGNVVKSYVTTQSVNGIDGRALGTNLTCPPLKDFLLMPYQQFAGSNGNFNYGMGLLLTHYFLHMEGGGKGLRITRFLQAVHAGHRGEAALQPLLGGSTYERLESDISAAWAKMGITIRFGK